MVYAHKTDCCWRCFSYALTSNAR